MSKRRELAPARAKKRPYSPKERKKRFLLCCEEDDAREYGKWTDNPTSGVWKLVENLCHESNVPIARL